jgi:hypothetical protein
VLSTLQQAAAPTRVGTIDLSQVKRLLLIPPKERQKAQIKLLVEYFKNVKILRELINKEDNGAQETFEHLQATIGLQNCEPGEMIF